MTDVAIPGGTLHTRVDGTDDRNGADDRPWLVLSNSLAADLGMWDDQIPLLTQRYRVLRYDTRGHGRSSVPPGPYGFPDLVGDVCAVMDAHGVARASFMGLSLGGMTGLGLALAHPERVERLVCCDARADNPPPFVQGWDERIAVVERAGMEGLVAGTLERWLTPATRAARPEAADRLAAMIRGTDPAGYRSCAAALKGLDYLKDLGRLTVPTVYVVGTEDAAAPPAAMRAMAEVTPDARLATVQDAAHIANVDNPEGFAKAIAGFLV